MKCPIPEEDLNKDELEYDVDTDNENYIKWITRGEGGSFEDSPTGLYAENNNNVATTSQENTFTNENQNNIDILNESSQCDYDNNIVNEYCIPEQNNNMQQLSKILEEDNISAEDPSDLHELISEEDSEKLEKMEKKIKKLKLQEDELKQKKLLLKNEERELELKIKKEKQKLELKRENKELELLESMKQSEQQDNMMNKKRNGLIPTQYNYTNQPLYYNEKYPKRQYINNVVYIAKEEKGIYNNLSGFKP